MDGDDKLEEGGLFVKSVGLSTAEADVLIKKYGRNELEEKKTPKWLIFASQLYQPMVSRFFVLNSLDKTLSEALALKLSPCFKVIAHDAARPFKLPSASPRTLTFAAALVC